jgi:hydroxysqualene dehydroxylase
MPEISHNKHVAIIGGGMAGLAAASSLAARGIKVTLFEAAPQLGGRARRVDYKDTKLDNGQHILLGAYSATLGLLKLAGVDEKQALMRLPLTLSMINLANKSIFSLQACNALPAPLHILSGLLLAKGVSFGNRLAAIKLMAWMKLNRFKLKQDVALASFLNAKNQPEIVIKNLWEPLCLAALNTPLSQASTQIFLNVLRDSFDKKKSDSNMLLPRVDLSSLIAEPLAAYIAHKSGAIKTSCTIKQIQQTEAGFKLTIDDADVDFSHVIIACAPHQLINIPVRPELVEGQASSGTSTSSARTEFNVAQGFSYQPITTVYLQYATHTTLPQAMTGLVSSVSQWVFDRGQICNQHGLMAVVISAHAPFEMSQDALAETVIAELNLAFPQLQKPLWTKVITEKRATFSCDANLQRPAAQTEIANLYLAGDYIKGDYPATIEGAVRSGIAAANLI